MKTFGQRLLRVHGSALTFVALLNVVLTTIGRITGDTIFGFMHTQPMVWVGLIQAYLLMTIIAVLLIINSRSENTHWWHAVGALAHCAPLAVALASMSLFAELNATKLAYAAIAFHTIFFLLESAAFLTTKKTV